MGVIDHADSGVYMNFYKLLHPQQLSVTKDKLTFNNWADGVITTKQAIREFKENNHLENDEEIDEDEFIKWLKTIGYWRGEHES